MKSRHSGDIKLTTSLYREMSYRNAPKKGKIKNRKRIRISSKPLDNS